MSAADPPVGGVGISALRGTPPAHGSHPADFGDGAAAHRSSGTRGGRPATPPSDAALLHPLLARGIAMVALCAFGALHWMLMMEPAEAYRAWEATGVALGVALLLVAAGRLPMRFAWPAAAVTGVAGLAFALLAGGLADELLWPSGWGSIAAAVGRGLGALPGARIPYRGLDVDLQLVIPLGGTVLAVAGSVLAFWPRRRGRTGFVTGAVVAFVTLYGVPAVALLLNGEFLRGALLAVLVVAFLRLERLRRRDAAPAALAAGAVVVVALALAPTIDTDNPWWDYETWSQSAAGARSATFSWDHDYGPLNWPRDGRELLRIKSPQRAYWKADNLDVFDGRRWRRDDTFSGRVPGSVLTDGVDLARLQRWSFRIGVTVRNLRSQTLPVAGSADAVDWPNQALFQIRPGIFAGSRSVHRGDAYSANVYLPQPSESELRQSGSNYTTGYGLQRYTGILVGTRSAASQELVYSERFGEQPVAARGDGSSSPAVRRLRSSELARTYALSRTLLARSDTPYEYVRAIERHLRRGFTYSETPPDDSMTLDGFLFDTKVGYCQQFSGAMALLLRLGGVPARVATGFSPGSYDRKAKQYVVRDFDAHSWVEAWFPGIGWAVLDPTPTSAPPRSQAPLFGYPTAGVGDVRDVGTTTVAARSADQPSGPHVPWPVIAAGIVALALALAGARRARTVRRRPPRPATLELERALRIADGGVEPSTTLAGLEARFEHWPAAAGYLQALRAQRYALSGSGPTPTQRRGLRRALAGGRGITGRLRALRALPPRPPHRHG